MATYTMNRISVTRNEGECVDPNARWTVGGDVLYMDGEPYSTGPSGVGATPAAAKADFWREWNELTGGQTLKAAYRRM